MAKRTSNKRAKRIMLGCVGVRDNDEWFILNHIRIKTSDLLYGANATITTYIGSSDEPKTKANIERFCEYLNLPKSVKFKIAPDLKQESHNG